MIENMDNILGVRIEVHSGRTATRVAWAAEMERACDIIIKIVHEVIPEVSFDAVHNSVVTRIQINRRQ